MDYQDLNAKTIDKWIDEGWEWGIPIDGQTYQNAKNGKWDVLLTPNKVVPKNWFDDLTNKKILGLASGGGQQMPIFNALGAKCYVLDYSQKQLDSEEFVANREGYEIDIKRADMTKPLPYPDDFFDIIFHPVSNVYVKDVLPIWKECFRVLKKGGRLLAGLDIGVNFIFDEDERFIKFSLPFDPLSNPEQRKFLEETDCGIQFSHTLEEQIGGQLKAGFVLKDLYEDTNSEGNLKDKNIPTFIATYSIKPV